MSHFIHKQQATITQTFFFSVFITILNVIILGIVYYPFFECLSQRKHIIMNLLGLAYTAPW